MNENIASDKAFVTQNEGMCRVCRLIAFGRFSSDTEAMYFPLTESAFVFGYVSEGTAELLASGTSFRLSGEDAFIISSAASSDLKANLAPGTAGHWFACNGTLPEALSAAFKIPTVTIRKADVSRAVANILSAIEKNDLKALCAHCYDFISELSFANTAAPLARDASKAAEADMIRTYIDNSIYSDISLDTVKNHFGITKMHAIRVFKAHFDMTPMQYAIKRRADISASLLATTDLPIKTISEMLHYSNTQHFSNTFKKIIGTSPNKYRTDAKKKG